MLLYVDMAEAQYATTAIALRDETNEIKKGLNGASSSNLNERVRHFMVLYEQQDPVGRKSFLSELLGEQNTLHVCRRMILRRVLEDMRTIEDSAKVPAHPTNALLRVIGVRLQEDGMALVTHGYENLHNAECAEEGEASLMRWKSSVAHHDVGTGTEPQRKQRDALLYVLSNEAIDEGDLFEILVDHAGWLESTTAGVLHIVTSMVEALNTDVIKGDRMDIGATSQYVGRRVHYAAMLLSARAQEPDRYRCIVDRELLEED
ncbi:hypothetical protein CALCODRAFT_511300 [Calocera cornea HHB12733]|uniref:Uncharacterized protein n=1 Tax=Calocera cornea HHB12733 TaxID=1353952 RepID=A0A165DUS7_9BASI|nr:hypothetical protein CALCODRAFT_511300 [Calocera cornea HHB12733]